MNLVDPTGEFPIETFWDLGNVLYDIGSAIVKHIQGDHKSASSNWENAVLDASAALLPYIPAGATKVIKGGTEGIKSLDKAIDLKKAEIIKNNAASGKAFEKQVGKMLGKNKVSQVTIEVADGTRTKVGFVQKRSGEIKQIEAKSSRTARLTKNQKIAYPQIEKTGGIVKGKNGIEIGFPQQLLNR